MISHTFLLLASASLVLGHGRVTQPPSRASAWRLGFPTPANYDDDGLNCGGFSTQWSSNGGKCGICGDSYSIPPPRPHELGGTYGLGFIVAKYLPGATIATTTHLTTSHMGYWEFKLCPDPTDNSQACFDKHLLVSEDGETKYTPKQGSGIYEVNYKLPSGLICEHCVLQWRYVAGNNWGICNNGTSGLGCGNQEEFRACSDIAIGVSKTLSNENIPSPLFYYLQHGFYELDQGYLTRKDPKRPSPPQRPANTKPSNRRPKPTKEASQKPQANRQSQNSIDQPPHSNRQPHPSNQSPNSNQPQPSNQQPQNSNHKPHPSNQQSQHLNHQPHPSNQPQNSNRHPHPSNQHSNAQQYSQNHPSYTYPSQHLQTANRHQQSNIPYPSKDLQYSQKPHSSAHSQHPIRQSISKQSNSQRLTQTHHLQSNQHPGIQQLSVQKLTQTQNPQSHRHTSNGPQPSNRNPQPENQQLDSQRLTQTHSSNHLSRPQKSKPSKQSRPRQKNRQPKSSKFLRYEYKTSDERKTKKNKRKKNKTQPGRVQKTKKPKRPVKVFEQHTYEYF